LSNDNGKHNLESACQLVDELSVHGLCHAVIAPGSRSTPLAVAFAAHPLIETRVLIDERSAGFFALGKARQLREPVACLCTSGTAAANYLPAVIEASLSRVPLIVLTADRPPELRDWGAAQTIDQIHLFGSHAKWFADLPIPAVDSAIRRHARATAARAFQNASMSPAGPVHLNVPYREPLLPEMMPGPGDLQALFAEGRRDAIRKGEGPGERRLSDATISHVAESITRAQRGLIVCGPGDPPHLAGAAARLASASGYPILADPLSSLRFGPHDRSHVVCAYDLFLRDPETAALLAPELVLRVGAMPTSKPLQQFLTAFPGSPHMTIEPGAPRDPFHLATETLAADPLDTLWRVSDAVRREDDSCSREWRTAWLELDRLSRETIALASEAFDPFFEGRVVAEVADQLPAGATLVVGNSMPVRDVDTFVHGGAREVRIVGTRGASGIDGVVSAALGAAAVSDGPVVLIVGDLSFHHDINALLAGQRFGLDATLVVLNNNGGGIFSFLPQRSLLDHETFEEIFGTPTDLSIAKAATLVGAAYARPGTWHGLRAAIERSIKEPGVSIVEVVTDRQTNLRQHREVAAVLLEAVRTQRPAGVGHA
jgi:2-succinyl-5-enolpyruvyl-6-hydroxy-3-cyclohexene-1-carboxylate synthase